MQFIHPGFLFALLALSIPIIVHLFNFRRYKTVYFSNVKFLREVKEETNSRSRLKHLLVLASRLFALAFLIFAFAQPYLPKKNQTSGSGKKYVSIYIDNSFSMDAVKDNSSLFDRAKQTAKEIASGYSTYDAFQLISNDVEGKHQRLITKDEFLNFLNDLHISPAVRSMEEISKLQDNMLKSENGKNLNAYVLSDFQKNSGDVLVDSNISSYLIPMQADEPSNVYIDTVWFSQPIQLIQQNVDLIVKVRNSGNKSIESNRLLLKLNNQTKMMKDFGIEPNSFIYDTLSFLVTQNGWNKIELQIQDFPITYDDNYFISFHVNNSVHILAVSESGKTPFLDALFLNQPEFQFSKIPPSLLATESLKGQQLVVLDNLNSISSSLAALLRTFIADGGSLVVFPGKSADLSAYNRFFNSLQVSSLTGLDETPQEVSSINLQQKIFRNIFERVPGNMNLPVVKKHFTLSQITTSGEEPLLTMKDGNSFLSAYPYQNGTLYLCASPLDKDFSDFPVHALFAPALYNMAVLLSSDNNFTFFIGDKTRIEIDAPKTSDEKVYRMKGENVEFIPEQFALGDKMLLSLGNQVSKAGFYELNQNNSDSSLILALNYNRKESDLRFNSIEDLKSKYIQSNVTIANGSVAEVSSIIKALDRGTTLWKWCLIIALTFLALETILIRFWKV